MNAQEKNEIIKMRKAGYGYSKIADTIGVSKNTVKSFCRRKNLSDLVETVPIFPVPDTTIVIPCLHCGKPVIQTPGRKQKKFCNDTCRNRYWNSHLTDVKRKAMYEYVCPSCGRSFFAYGNRNRKYCSHDCYIKDRFGGMVCK